MTRSFRAATALICAVLLFGIACKSSVPTSGGFVAYTSADSDSKIKWRNWDSDAFADAQKSDKPVFLFLTQAWCAPCSQMETEILNADSVAARINQDFLPIRIDGERYPNLYERYHLPGYPSCAVLTPDARLVGGTTYMSADSLKQFLTQFSRYWTNNRDAVLNQANKLQASFIQTINQRKVQPLSDIVLMLAQTAIRKQYDSVYGGFGNQPKFPQPIANDFMFESVAPTGGPVFREAIVKTMDAQLALLDTVWGGFYRYAAFADWSGASHEKLLDLNAQLLSNYLDAYLLTHDEKYRQAAELTITYLDRFLRGKDGWGFYTGQQGAIQVDGRYADADEYFAQSDEARSAQGIPAIDKSMYTEQNCQAIRAYLKAERTLGRRDCGAYAVKSLDRLMDATRGTDNGLYHDPLNVSQSAFGLLPDQVAAIQALIDAYETTGNKKYLTGAHATAAFVSEHLVDRDSGGARYELPQADSVGRMAVTMKPFSPNADAVVAFMRLYHMTGKREYLSTADGIVKYLFHTPLKDDDLRFCKLASSYVWGTRAPLTFVVVGKPGADYHSLLRTAWQTYYPRLVVLQLDSGVDEPQLGRFRFPVTGKPSLYVCRDTLRSEGFDDTTTVTAKIREFLRSR